MCGSAVMLGGQNFGLNYLNDRSDVVDVEAGAYLTEQLRRNHPEPFEQEIVRNARRARLGGFVWGVVSSVLVVGGFLGASVVNGSALVETLFGVR